MTDRNRDYDEYGDSSEFYNIDSYPQEGAPESQNDDFNPDFGDAFDDYGEYDDEEAYTEEPEVPQKKKPRRRKKRIVPLFLKILIYIVAVSLLSVGLGFAAWECAEDVLAFGRSSDTVQVTIEDGATLDDIAQMLQDQGLIKYPWLFKFYCKFTHSADSMAPGTYQLQYNYDYHALNSGMRKNSANRTEITVTIPEGKTCAQIFSLMEEKGVCSADALKKCAAETEFDYWFLEGIPYGQENRLEGFLFPDTYYFYLNDDAERVLNKLLANFNRKFSEDAQAQLETLNAALADRLAARGYDESYIEANKMTVYRLITVASMVEKETAGAKESSDIASVIYNRLCRPADYPYLNIDATVIYGLGGITGSLTYEQTQIDGPYNTYTRQGLPAGPISNPGLNSISAALNPSDTNYYFYALDESTGYHHFSETYDEHNRFLESQNG